MTVRAVTALVPEGPGLRYWTDHDSYDALVDDALTPTIYDEDEPDATTARAARRIHFQTVTDATYLRPGELEGPRWDVPASTAPAPCAPSSLAQSARASGQIVRGRSADTPSGP